MKTPEWLPAVIICGSIIGGIMLWHSYHPTINDPEAEKIAKAQDKAESLKIELQYEHEFYEEETKNIKEGLSFPTIARVVAPNGGIVTGRMLFISQCPPKRLCAQPDGSLEDEDGDDWNNAEMSE